MTLIHIYETRKGAVSRNLLRDHEKDKDGQRRRMCESVSEKESHL